MGQTPGVMVTQARSQGPFGKALPGKAIPSVREPTEPGAEAAAAFGDDLLTAGDEEALPIPPPPIAPDETERTGLSASDSPSADGNNPPKRQEEAGETPEPSSSEAVTPNPSVPAEPPHGPPANGRSEEALRGEESQ